MRPGRASSVVAPFALLSVMSCGGDSTKGVTTPLTTTTATASLFIDSIVPRLYVGRTAQLSFQVRDRNGAAISGRTVQWSSSGTSVATISSAALLSGVSAGSATITGTVDEVSASRAITVLPMPSALITLSPDIATLARGSDLTLSPVVTDVDGKLVTGHAVTFVTSNAAIATVSPSGIVHPIANGSVNITATVDGDQQAIARLTVLDPRVVSGIVATSDGGPLPPLVFTARFNAGATTPQKFTATVDGTTGAFALTMPAFTTAGPPVEFFVDVTAGARAYHPSWLSLPGGITPGGSRILLIPRSVTPDSGTFAGQRFVVNLNDAFTPVCTDASNANCQSYWPNYFLSGIKNWADDARPIPIAFDRSTGDIAPADSAAMWDVIRTMESDLGRKLFKPANFTGFTSTGYTRGMVLASFDPSLSGFSGYTNWSWDAQSVIYQARVRMGQTRYFANNSLVTHELNHALGFHHTCRWQTVMGGYGCGQDGRLSAPDVAYFHLAEQVRRRAATFQANWSVTEALQGLRVVELGLPASTALPAMFSPVFSRILLPMTDGAP